MKVNHILNPLGIPRFLFQARCSNPDVRTDGNEDDGRVELDSNTVERSIRPLALNRKNALFVGSDEGGDNWAVIATLIENCKIHGINPHAWLADTLSRLAAGHPANAVGEIMPWNAVA